jgi:MerR HTH family regulatory protein
VDGFHLVYDRNGHKPVTSATLHDVARKIKRPGEPLRKAVDRIHYWVRAGAISPGRKHPGTGGRRRYPADTALRVALLQAARGAGLSPEDAMFVLGRPEYLAPFLKPDMSHTEKTLLVVSSSFDGKLVPNVGMFTPAELADRMTKPLWAEFDVHSVVDAGKIRARLSGGEGSGPLVTSASGIATGTGTITGEATVVSSATVGANTRGGSK